MKFTPSTMKATQLMILIGLLCIMPVSTFAAPFVILGAETEDPLDDNEVLDVKTGLIWKRCPAGIFWNGVNCGNQTLVQTHEEALGEAEFRRNQEAPKQWRLPNIKELASLVDTTQFEPAIDSNVFSNTRFFVPGSVFANFWSATPLTQDSSFVYSLSFQDGEVKTTNRSELGFTRLVRSQ